MRRDDKHSCHRYRAKAKQAANDHLLSCCPLKTPPERLFDELPGEDGKYETVEDYQ